MLRLRVAVQCHCQTPADNAHNCTATVFEAISWHATKGLAAVCYPRMVLQASQVRKSNYVPEKGLDYDPDKNHTSTVYAGTCIQQVHSDSLFTDMLSCQCCIPIPRSMLTMWRAALDLFGVTAALSRLLHSVARPQFA